MSGSYLNFDIIPWDGKLTYLKLLLQLLTFGMPENGRNCDSFIFFQLVLKTVANI